MSDKFYDICVNWCHVCNNSMILKITKIEPGDEIGESLGQKCWLEMLT